ncbi:MAG: UDP-N-acetylmuramoyl-L-alanine--D-glutamate ligase, partial [Candidatus Omnitrophica bacterium]|nr:UDP-N-acetylmuramoyl-L-alanine--D-glutamate ligase [Candidatus Omnitrophota bacterium]
MMDFKDKKVLVIGLGASGCAAAGFLAGKGAIVRVTENAGGPDIGRRAETLKSPRISIETGGHTKGFCADAEIAVVSPGVDVKSRELTAVLPEGIRIIGELELGFMFCPAPVVAVTGTNGKSTTVELIGRILSFSGKHVVVCGNIGPPFTGRVEELRRDSIAVVEVSSFQLETIRDFRPEIAVLLNVTEDHYDRHRSYNEYKKEKFRIFMNQDKNDWAVVYSDMRADGSLKGIKSRLAFFGRDKGMVKIKGADIIAEAGPGEPGFIMKTSEVPLRGGHNLDNVLCSILVSRIMGVDSGPVRKALSTFKGLEHRFESVGFLNGVEYIDDSKATNIDATKRALESLNKKTVLIAGGRDKGGDYRSILPLIREKVKMLVVM